MPQSYRSQVLDHLGLVAGMFDELGIGALIAQATRQNPETRLVTVGHAVKAMVLNGLGFVQVVGVSHQVLGVSPGPIELDFDRAGADSAQSTSQHPLHRWGMKPTVSDETNSAQCLTCAYQG